MRHCMKATSVGVSAVLTQHALRSVLLTLGTTNPLELPVDNFLDDLCELHYGMFVSPRGNELRR
jgi:hypothetical protein